MTKSLLLKFILLTTLLCAVQSTYASSKRVALVIGNSAYKDAPLKNPSNDAQGMAAKLKKLGFEVDKQINADKRMMKQAIRNFGKKLQQKDTIGLFYFAGHGVQLDGSNYLLPVKSNIETEDEIEFEAINAAEILRKMERSENNLNLVILDACRNNPFARSFRSASRGLAKMEAPTGSMILYATSPGNVAADGQGSNGLFTEKLLKMMDKKGLKIEEVFKKTAIAVNQASEKKQSPYIEGFILGDFYFSGSNVVIQQAPVQVASAAPDIASKAENRFWDAVIADPSKDMYEAYLNNYSNGFYADIAKIKLKKFKRQSASKPEPKITIGKLTIRSNVGGDTVTLNGKNYGSTRLDLTLAAGKYKLVISKTGYEDYTKTVQISSGSNQTIRGHLTREGSDLSAYGIDMVHIPGGNFKMGSPSNEKGRNNDEKQHHVYVNNFKINRTEVTLNSFRQFISDTGYRTDAEKNTGGIEGCWSRKNGTGKWAYIAGYNYKNPGFSQSNTHPVVCVSHTDVMAYIKWLNSKTSETFRLPTEAELEYVIRGGKKSSRFWSNAIDSKACQYANIADNEHWGKAFPCKDGYQYTSPVGNYRSNPYGLKDIAGNVWEWSCSSYSKSYDGSEQRCSSSANVFSLRGCSWNSIPSWVRSAVRNQNNTFTRFDDTGFRLVQVR